MPDTYTGELSCWRCCCSNTPENPITIVKEEHLCMECIHEATRKERDGEST